MASTRRCQGTVAFIRYLLLSRLWIIQGWRQARAEPLVKNLVPLRQSSLVPGEKRLHRIENVYRLNLVALGKLPRDLHTFGHLTEDRVVAVQFLDMSRMQRFKGDIELAAICVRAGICHCHDTDSLVGDRWIDFVFNAITWIPCACPQRITPLGHKTGHNTVKGETVIKFSGRQIQKIRCRYWCLVREQRRVDFSLCGMNDYSD